MEIAIGIRHAATTTLGRKMLIMVEPTNHMISCDFIEGPTKRSTNSAILLLSPVVSQDLVRISAPRSNTTRSVKY